MSSMDVIDAHVHVFTDEVTARPAECFDGEPCFELLYADPKARLISVAKLIEAMDADGVGRSVVCGFPWRDPGRARDHNDAILQAAKDHPDRLVPLAGVDPLADSAIPEAERALAAGAAGLGEVGVYLADLGDADVFGRVVALAKLCAEADRPMLLHTNEPVGHTYPGKAPMSLRGLYGLVAACPKTRFQLAHLGGGLFMFELLKKEVRGVLKNCVFDTAAAPYLYRPEVYSVFVQLAGAKRLLYGSDYPLLGLERYLKDMTKAGLAPDLQAQILGDNAKAFWRLP